MPASPSTSPGRNGTEAGRFAVRASITRTWASRTRGPGRRPHARPVAAAAIAAAVLFCAIAIVSCGSDQAPAPGDPQPPGGQSGQPVVGPGPPGSGFGSGTTILARARELQEGLNLVSRAPEDLVSTDRAWQFGDQVALAYSRDGNPILAFTRVLDANSDTRSIELTIWDPKRLAWSKPVEIHKGRLSSAVEGAPPFSLAVDTTTGAIGVAYENQNEAGVATSLLLAFSTNGGEDWSRTEVVDHEAYSPSLALSHAKVFVGFRRNDGFSASTAPALSEDSPWSEDPAPSFEGYSAAEGTSPSIAVDESDTPGMAYALASQSGSTRLIAYWRLGDPEPTKVMESSVSVGPGTSTEGAPVTLGFRGRQPVVAAPLRAEGVAAGSPPGSGETTGTTAPARASTGSNPGTGTPRTGVAIFVASSRDGGASFSDAAAIPGDGSQGEIFNISQASDADHTVLGWTSNRPPAPGACGLPKVAVSDDLARWRTCSPDRDGSHRFRTGRQIGVAIAPGGGTAVAFANVATDAPEPAGIYLWLAKAR